MIIQKGNEWKQKIINEGWEYTIDGWLSPDDIEKSGLVYKNGKWFIPSQTYIAENNNTGRKKGQKYIGPSEQYLKWRKEYNTRKYGYESIDDKIAKEIAMEIKIEE